MSRLVCLANSARPGGQCIAGIDLDTRQWVRPVPRDGDAVPIERCVIDNKFLSTLDIIQTQQEFVRPAGNSPIPTRKSIHRRLELVDRRPLPGGRPVGAV